MVLDEDYRILHVGDPMVREHAGRNLWEAFPQSRPLFQPYYDQARRTGKPVEFVQFYAGYVARVRAVPVGKELHLFWEHLDRIDTLTLEGLRDSIAHALAIVEEQEAYLRREHARRRLRVVEADSP
jgi:hypothetical protein